MNARTRRAGFTLIELLGVMVIIMILVGISVPAFSNLMRSSRASIADGALRVALASARDAAISSPDGGDGAAVFLFEPGEGASVVTCLEVGRLRTLNEGGVFETFDVFVPDPRYEVQELPKNWLVRGLSSASDIVEGLSDSEPGVAAWYGETGDRQYDDDAFNWVLPETGFFNPEEEEEGRKRQTFMIRFDSASGAPALSKRDSALVFLPSVDIDRSRGAWGRVQGKGWDPLRSSDHVRLVREIVSWPTGGGDGVAPRDKDRLLGDVSTDTALVRPVSHVALYEVQNLARRLRAEGVSFEGINKRTGSLYGIPPRNQDPAPIFSRQLAEAVNRHLPRVAEVFTIDRYSGRPSRIPTREEDES